jgi:hypothetical protein
MGKKKEKLIQGFVMFDVVYEDGSKSSRRKIAAADIAELGEAHAKTMIMDQDRKIAEMSGNARGPIQSITRSAG